MLWAVRFLLLALALPLSYFAASLFGAIIPAEYTRHPGIQDQTIGLLRGPIHYDILLPMTPETRADFGFAQRYGLAMDHPDARWLIIGWGAKEFYTTVGSYQDLSLRALWRAISGDQSVVRLDLAGEIGDTPAISWVKASQGQIAALRALGLAALARDAAGAPIPVALPAGAPQQTFFHAVDGFHLGKTCNAWVGQTLRKAGFAVGIWTPTPQALALSLRWFAQQTSLPQYRVE